MQVEYCDLCDSVIKETEMFTLYIAAPFVPRTDNYGNTYEGESDYYSYVDRVRKESKKICPVCKHIFDEIFRLRRNNLSQLTEEILNISHLSTKDNDKKKKEEK
jgi:hypothetical protein